MSKKPTKESKHGTGPGAWVGLIADMILAPSKKKPKKK